MISLSSVDKDGQFHGTYTYSSKTNSESIFFEILKLTGSLSMTNYSGERIIDAILSQLYKKKKIVIGEEGKAVDLVIVPQTISQQRMDEIISLAFSGRNIRRWLWIGESHPPTRNHINYITFSQEGNEKVAYTLWEERVNNIEQFNVPGEPNSYWVQLSEKHKQFLKELYNDIDVYPYIGNGKAWSSDKVNSTIDSAQNDFPWGGERQSYFNVILEMKEKEERFPVAHCYFHPENWGGFVSRIWKESLGADERVGRDIVFFRIAVTSKSQGKGIAKRHLPSLFSIYFRLYPTIREFYLSVSSEGAWASFLMKGSIGANFMEREQVGKGKELLLFKVNRWPLYASSGCLDFPHLFTRPTYYFTDNPFPYKYVTQYMQLMEEHGLWKEATEKPPTSEVSFSDKNSLSSVVDFIDGITQSKIDMKNNFPEEYIVPTATRDEEIHRLPDAAYYILKEGKKYSKVSDNFSNIIFENKKSISDWTKKLKHWVVQPLVPPGFLYEGKLRIGVLKIYGFIYSIGGKPKIWYKKSGLAMIDRIGTGKKITKELIGSQWRSDDFDTYGGDSLIERVQGVLSNESRRLNRIDINPRPALVAFSLDYVRDPRGNFYMIEVNRTPGIGDSLPESQKGHGSDAIVNDFFQGLYSALTYLAVGCSLSLSRDWVLA